MDDGAFLRKLQTKKMQPNTLVLEQVCPATRLLEKRRQMFEVQEALEAHKEDFSRKEEIFRRREENLKKKDLQLQESLIRFSKFLQENDAKKARAEKKAAEEIKAQNAKEKEIRTLKKNMAKLLVEKEQAKETLDKHSKYKTYLESVLESSEEFQEIPELLSRYETLKSTNEDLVKRQEEVEKASQEVKDQLQSYVHEKADEIVVHNNRIAQLKREIEACDIEASTRESHKDSAMTAAAQKTLEFGQVILATQNLFQRCRENSVIAHSDALGPLEQLEVIGNFVSDLDMTIQQGLKG